MVHELKIYTQHFRDLMLGLTKIQVRKKRPKLSREEIYSVLNEFDPNTGCYTGRQEIRKVDWIIRNVAGLDPDFVILQLTTK